MSTEAKTTADVEAALEEFRGLLNSSLQPKLKLTELYRVRSLGKAKEEDIHWPKQYEEVWGDPWGNKEVGAGVYLHFNEDDQALYVGKAVSLGDRLGAYFQHVDYPRDQACKVVDNKLDDDNHKTCGVKVIPMPANLRLLTPALESFLIEKLNPPVNTQGRTDWE